MIESERLTRDTATVTARELLDVLNARGVRTFVVSPGSRNTPLLIGLDARDEIKKIIINDERTAAFAALGYSLASREPVALVCTSGTALYNYSPAIAEAYYQHIPLIVITADRPSQWIDQDDSQTLRQHCAMEKIVKRSFDIHSDAGSGSECASNLFPTEREWYANRVANEAVTVATSPSQGPVHINIQFADPLNQIEESVTHEVRTVETLRGENMLSTQTLNTLAGRLAGKRVLIVAGYMPPCDALDHAIRKCAGLPNVAVMCETISNLHLGEENYMIDSLLTHVSEEELDELRPDVCISIGGALVSRLLKDFLRRCDRMEHWTVTETEIPADCMQRLAVHVDADPVGFFNGIADASARICSKEKQAAGNGDRIMPGVAPGYGDTVRKIRQKVAAQCDQFLRNAGWTELKALDMLFRRLPADFNLFLSNGTCVRYAQLLTRDAPHASYCNRGVSGIDGGNATALGVAIAYGSTTLLLTGDMSFSYCPEILHLVDDDADLRIVVINNSGGGIFRFIKTTRDLPMREEYFCSSPELQLKGLATAYGWNYLKAEDEVQLEAALDVLLNDRRTILEICADAEESARTLIKYLGK